MKSVLGCGETQFRHTREGLLSQLHILRLSQQGDAQIRHHGECDGSEHHFAGRSSARGLSEIPEIVSGDFAAGLGRDALGDLLGRPTAALAELRDPAV